MGLFWPSLVVGWVGLPQTRNVANLGHSWAIGGHIPDTNVNPKQQRGAVNPTPQHIPDAWATNSLTAPLWWGRFPRL